VYWMKLLFVVCCVACLPIAIAGCGKDDGMGHVSGKISVDGQIPPAGSSITFFPVDGNTRSAGAVLEEGKYSVDVPQGEARVEIRIPKQVPNPNPSTQGPGAGDRVMEALPPKYNDQSELKLNVAAGSNEKDWNVSIKP
jgi:hypothetical protein